MIAEKTVERSSRGQQSHPRTGHGDAQPSRPSRYSPVGHEILDPESQRALLACVSDPDAPDRIRRAAEEKLVVHYMRLVYSLAARQLHRYADGRGPLGQGTVAASEDLVQEGVVGLIVAIRRFDPSHRRDFAAYAARLVRQRVRHAAEEGTRPIRLPEHTASALAARRRAYVLLSVALGRDPEVGELANELNWSEARTASVDETAQWMSTLRAVPLGAPGEAQSDERLPLHDTLADRQAGDDDPLLQRVGAEALSEAISRLDEREREIVERRHGLCGRDPESLHEVARKMGISHEGVRKGQRRAQQKLKAMLAPALIGASRFRVA